MTEKINDLRRAIIILHRKEPSQDVCICGTKMKYINNKFVCPKQDKLDEPNTLQIHLPNKNALLYLF